MFHAGEHLDDPLGEWYVYYAPHDAPGGINVMYADSLDGPWTHYEGNPIVKSTWDGHYDVSHVSSPDVAWNDDAGEVFLYFHGENNTDRYATSADGLSFDYGGVVMTTQQFGQNATETSYNRVFENPFPENGWEYAMYFMVNDTSNVRRIGLAYSHDMISWEAQPGWVVEPTAVEGANVAGPELWEWNGTYYVLYGSSVGTIFAKQVDRDLRGIGDPIPLYIPSPFPPEDGRASSPQIVTADGKTHMIFEAGGRLGATVHHATLDPDGHRDPVNTHPDDPLFAQCSGAGSDEFDGDALETRWTVLHDDEGRQRLEDGALVLTSPATSINGATIPNLPVPDGAWEVTTEIEYAPTAKYHQAGLTLYSDDLNNAKLVWSFANGGIRFDFTWKRDGKDRFDSWAWEDTLFPPADLGSTAWLRLSSNGEYIVAALSTDGTTFTTVGRPIPAADLAADSIGVTAFRGVASAPDAEARFNWFRFTPSEAELADCASDGTAPGDDTDPGNGTAPGDGTNPGDDVDDGATPGDGTAPDDGTGPGATPGDDDASDTDVDPAPNGSGDSGLAATGGEVPLALPVVGGLLLLTGAGALVLRRLRRS
ncbi:hypothetical protein WDU99_12240 [Microbacterium sp. Mu-80]|uniref:Beta-xylosidase C-terminal Concanavalin A-like domain-containing protein n=1 Tax=Microbacterium bandirmense TaxID=3122050 RepID=A0ABU8LCN1_9MICO